MSREITICCPSCTVAPNPADTQTEQTAYQRQTAYWANLLYFEIYTFSLLWRLTFAFSALTLLDGNQEQHPTCKMTQSKHNTHTRLTALFPGLPGWAGTRKVNQSGFSSSKRQYSEWQWHQLGHMQICTSLQTDNHTSTPPLSFLQAGCPSCRSTNSVKALKAQ